MGNGNSSSSSSSSSNSSTTDAATNGTKTSRRRSRHRQLRKGKGIPVDSAAENAPKAGIEGEDSNVKLRDGRTMNSEGRKFSHASLVALKNLEDIKAKLDEFHEELYKLSLEAASTDETEELATVKTRLAIMNGDLNKFQASKIDGIVSQTLDTGQSEVKATRKDFNAQADKLVKEVQDVHQGIVKRLEGRKIEASPTDDDLGLSAGKANLNASLYANTDTNANANANANTDSGVTQPTANEAEDREEREFSEDEKRRRKDEGGEQVFKPGTSTSVSPAHTHDNTAEGPVIEGHNDSEKVDDFDPFGAAEMSTAGETQANAEPIARKEREREGDKEDEDTNTVEEDDEDIEDDEDVL